MDEAYAGDVVGIVGNYDLRIGDTLTETPGIVFDETPRFVPECFAYLQSLTSAQYKRFREGLEQLLQEGVVQQFYQPHSAQRVPLLGAVGPLQFEVVQYRLKSEYNADAQLEAAPYRIIRWLRRKDGAPWTDESVNLPSGTALALDEDDQPIVLFVDALTERFFNTRNEAMIEILPEPAQ